MGQVVTQGFRRQNVWCSEEDIEIPGGHISGPDLNLEQKEFIAILTINDYEKVN